jgi:hypothetical protein
MKHLLTLLFCVLVVGLVVGACAHTSASGVTEAGARVDVGKGDPPAGMTEMGAFEATDPLACAADGKPGSEGAALAELRNRAAQLGADYVQIFRTGPDQCGRVVIRAMAFKRAVGETPATPSR